jgi:hypothetical protein
VYLSALPGHRKLLPRPCPQCGQENGGIQFVFFNPHYYEARTGYRRYRPYHLLRISHYSKEEYRLKKHNPTKVWHNLRFRNDWKINKGRGSNFKVISIDELFNEPDYLNKKSVTMGLLPSWYEGIKEQGWRVLGLMHERAHWINKDGPKKCPKCDKVVEQLEKCFIYFEEMDEYLPYWNYYVWLCDSCAIEKETRRLKQKQSIVASPPLLPS